MNEEIQAHLIVAFDALRDLHILGRDLERALELKHRLQAATQLLSRPPEPTDLSSKPLKEEDHGT